MQLQDIKELLLSPALSESKLIRLIKEMSQAFTSDRDGQRNIWIYNVRKKKSRQLTLLGGMYPTWSSDGKYIAFSSLRKYNQSDLFIIDVNDIDDYQTTFQLTSGNALDTQPFWSSTSNEIVFIPKWVAERLKEYARSA